jgi:hypothetical protein
MRKSFVLVFVVLAFCLLSTVLTQAQTVPWMTGEFGNSACPYGCNPFYVQGFNSGPSLMFDITANPIVGDVTWDWQCDDQLRECHGQGSGAITGGDVVGGIYDMNNNFAPRATLAGSVTGGFVLFEEWTGMDNSYWDRYYYSFSGEWTNGFSTVAEAYSSTSSDGGVDEFSLTTYSPEPGTLLTLASGILGVVGVARKRFCR